MGREVNQEMCCHNSPGKEPKPNMWGREWGGWAKLGATEMRDLEG